MAVVAVVMLGCVCGGGSRDMHGEVGTHGGESCDMDTFVGEHATCDATRHGLSLAVSETALITPYHSGTMPVRSLIGCLAVCYARSS